MAARSRAIDCNCSVSGEGVAADLRGPVLGDAQPAAAFGVDAEGADGFEHVLHTVDGVQLVDAAERVPASGLVVLDDVVEGNDGRFGESAKCCVSSAKPARQP